MEGFLLERREDVKTGLMKSGKIYKRRWVELQDQELTVYEDAVVIRPPMKKKEGFTLSGCVVEQIQEEEENFVIKISPPADSEDKTLPQRAYRFAAEDENTMNMWINALKVEADPSNARDVSFKAQVKTLGLRPRFDGAPNTKAEIVKAYRKAVVTAHPDKGGDEVLFQRIQSAYDKAVKYVEDYAADVHPTEYKVSIKKTVEVGIGIKVVEEDNTGEVIIRGMHENCVVNEIGDSAGGTLAEGDVLVKIEDDDVSEYRFSRIRQRLNEFRVPTGSDVVLTFLRPATSEASMSSPDSTGVTVKWGDGEQEGSSSTDDIRPLEQGYEEQTHEMTEANVDMASINASVALQRQVRDLQVQFKSTEEALAAEQARSAALEAEVTELRKQVEQANSNVLVAQKAKSYAKKQLQEFIVHGSAPDESAAAEVMQKLLSSAEAIIGGKPLFMSEKVSAYIKEEEMFAPVLEGESTVTSSATTATKGTKGARNTEGGGGTSRSSPPGYVSMADNGGKVDLQSSLRIALAATSTLDPTGQLLERWQASGNGAAEMILSLERKLQKVEGAPRDGFEIPADMTAHEQVSKSPSESLYQDPHDPHNSQFAKSHSPKQVVEGKAAPAAARDGFRHPSPKKLGGGMSFQSRAGLRR